MKYFLLCLFLTGCITGKTCPATKDARAAVVTEVMKRYACTDKQQVEGTVDALSDWKCKLKDELIQALPSGEYSVAKEDCLLLAKKLAVVLDEGMPSEWTCTGTSQDHNLENVCAGL